MLIVEEGNPIVLYLPNDVLRRPIVDVRSFSNKPIKVIYEDSQILIVDKPAGLLCHSDRTNKKDTLITRVYYHLYNQGAYNPSTEQSFSQALCNRIDQGTSGIVLIGKTSEALRVMNEKSRLGEFKRYYLCVVEGKPVEKRRCP